MIVPKLDYLANNGGPTPTHALSPDSPAIDAGSPDPYGSWTGCWDRDQRFVPRPQDGNFDGQPVCDMGACEFRAPELSVADASVTEGNKGTKNMVFSVSLSFKHTESVTVYYATSDGTAKAGSDYRSTSGSVVLRPGEVSKNIAVKIIGDGKKEPDETLSLTVSSGNARINHGTAVGTIRNDD